MSTMIIFFPIVGFIVLFFIFFYKKTGKPLSVKVTHWLFIIYVSVLLLSLLGSFFIKGKELDIRTGEIQNFFSLLERGKIEDIPENNILKKEIFDFTEDELFITAGYTNEHFHSVIIEEKEEDDGKLELYIYGNIQINNMNFTEKLASPKVELVNNQLTFYQLSFQEIKVVSVKKDFVVHQFQGKELFSTRTHVDYPCVYLRIPKGLKIIEDDHLYFQYINK